ncbi:hypothetical protein Ddye_027283 [Dipteronia dyeriana]|uniref:DUF382 domain-containing protein n=1 Tax=Dipteronia dyeriana TaxID=168575 RepID=A0AAD9TPM5_9ROSI|nr:hypothetical protein Ddye_027283 [Dipteronia dyeriana]
MEKMWKTKGGVYVGALLMMLVTILFISANPSTATSLVPKMSSNDSASGSGCSSIHDCLIADHQSLEFLLGSEADKKQTFDISKALNGGKPIVDCGRGKNYKCSPGPHGAKVDEHCTDTLRQPKPQLCSNVSICSTSDLLIRFTLPKAKASLPQRSICSSSPSPNYLNESKMWYTIAADPKLLVFLKAYRNTVPVLRHWCQKRKFLQGKRGIEKQPFQLPDFIAATGIAKIRQID